MTSLIVGSSSGLGRALADALAAAGHDVLLLASDARDLEAQCADLSLRYSIRAEMLACHIAPQTDWLALFAQKIMQMDRLDSVYFALGATREDDTVAQTPEQINTLFETNLSAIMKMTAVCLKHQKSGVIVGMGSVAAIRGRSSNVAYAAAKRGLASYFESLRHALTDTQIRVQFYQLGYLDTPRNDGKKLLFPKASPVKIAHTMVRKMNDDVGTVTLPWFWNLLHPVVRFLPWRIYKQLQF